MFSGRNIALNNSYFFLALKMQKFCTVSLNFCNHFRAQKNMLRELVADMRLEFLKKKEKDPELLRYKEMKAKQAQKELEPKKQEFWKSLREHVVGREERERTLREWRKEDEVQGQKDYEKRLAHARLKMIVPSLFLKNFFCIAFIKQMICQY